MSQLKVIEREQNAALVDKAAGVERFPQPRQGWIKAVRTALGMSGTTLSKRLGGHRSMASYLERAEMDGGITVKKLREAADAMGCELVYTLVPKATPTKSSPDVGSLLSEQAHRKAEQLVKRATVHMALEAQELDQSAQQKEIGRLHKSYLDKMPKDFWED